MTPRERLHNAHESVVNALARRRGRPHIDKAEAVEIGLETVEAVKAALVLGARGAALRADGSLSLADTMTLAPLAAALGCEVGEVWALIDQGMKD